MTTPTTTPVTGEALTITLTMQVPADLEARIRALGPVEWGHTGFKPDAAHVEEFANSLSATREHFGVEGDADLQGVYAEGSDIVVAHTGTSPNSANHARILVGLWNALHHSLGATPEAGLTSPQVEAPSVDGTLAETAPLADREKSADPHPLASYPDGLTPGLYAIHWTTGGRSLAAIGMKEDGSRWIAPVNWLAPSTQSYGDTWEHIEMAVPIVEDREVTLPHPHHGA